MKCPRLPGTDYSVDSSSGRLRAIGSWSWSRWQAERPDGGAVGAARSNERAAAVTSGDSASSFLRLLRSWIARPVSTIVRLRVVRCGYRGLAEARHYGARIQQVWLKPD